MAEKEEFGTSKALAEAVLEESVRRCGQKSREKDQFLGIQGLCRKRPINRMGREMSKLFILQEHHSGSPLRASPCDRSPGVEDTELGGIGKKRSRKLG